MLGETVGGRLIDALNSTENPLARESYADIVSELRLEGALDSLIRHFETEWENRRFYAFCLGRMGDPRVAGILEDALQAADLRYLDYIAIRDAYELLGGLLELERDFSGDPDYIALIGQEE
ncbi:MAG: HEAT repeat domain-containing protein [Bacillota bacterium]